ncbi:DNA cytosine methyltransferase [Micromonospora fulviviridis]|uniref:DNA cytosine methyltransferase n=1 Tax=Micromonospora fulviviridis TaxID=47860 RepID=UPI0037A297A7
MTLQAIDLFSGAGGMSLGLAKAGFSVRAAVDNWAPAVRSYRANFSHPIYELNVAELTADRLADMSGVSVGGLDLLAGGPPCQGFSIQRIGADLDTRNDLVLEFARLVSEFQPRMFLMENVPGLLGRRGAHTLTRFGQMLSAAEYEWTVDRVDAVDYGVPQSRRRVLVIGWRSDERPFALPKPRGEQVTVRQAFADLPKPAPPGAPDPADPLHVTSRLSPINAERLRHIPPGGGFMDLPLELRVNCHRNGADAIGHRAVYGRLHPDKPAGVITARFDSFTRGRFAHPLEDRNITLREGARLQSFPDDFVFLGNREEVAAQIGNAVPPTVARSVGAAIIEHLSGRTEQMAPRESTQLALFP